MTAKEARIFTALADTVVAPRPVLPPVEQTDAADFFADWLRLAPRLNATGLRAALRLLDAGSLLTHRRRFTALPSERRADYLTRVERSQLRAGAKALKGIAFLCYYGDDALMRRLGYDADANVRRARELRTREGRP